VIAPAISPPVCLPYPSCQLNSFGPSPCLQGCWPDHLQQAASCVVTLLLLSGLSATSADCKIS
jgi:hypothetical protein